MIRLQIYSFIFNSRLYPIEFPYICVPILFIMRQIFSSFLFCLLLTSPLSAQPSQEDSTAFQQRMDWFATAKLGIFIHWGIYAVNGVSESWSFHNGYLPYEQYMKQAKGFGAERYAPQQWVKLIEESGARYTVITAKHHDGVALWDTKLSGLSTKKSTLAARDVLTPFVEEVKKHKNLRLGLYYSLIDWSHEDYPGFLRDKARYEIKNDSARWQRFCHFNMGQMEELAKAYNPDLWWFDGDWEHSAKEWRSAEIVQLIRKYNPQCIINSRIQGYGDYATPEQGVPVVRPKEKYWELCMTMNDSWGYQHTDRNYKSVQQLLRTYVDCLSNGGNFLLDIAPKADGTLPQEQVEVLKAFGRWNRKHAAAVYNTRAGLPSEHFQGYTTLNPKGNILYLYLPYRPTGPIEVKGLMNRVHRAWVVGHGARLTCKVYNKAYWSELPGNLYIDVPEDLLDPNITVIALLLDGPCRIYRGEGQVITSN